jgi:hypothetical protein
MKRRVVFGQKNQKQKQCTIVVVLLCSFLSSINPFQVCFFFKKNQTFRVPTHISREQGVGRGSQEGRKKKKKKPLFLFLPSHTN